MTEFRLFDSPGAEVAQITTDGATVKPYLNVIQTVDNEAKIHVTEDGLHTKLVDPANVFMADIHVPASAFDVYNVRSDEILGCPIGGIQEAVKRARKGHDDNLELSLRDRELTATVSRGYDNHEVVSQSTVSLIDPDALRSEPDLPDIDLPVDVTIDFDPFMDAFGYAIDSDDYTQIETKQVNQHATALYMGSESDTRSDRAAIDSIETDESVESLYSSDYLKDLRDGLKQIDPETVRVRLGESFPMFVNAESEGIEVEYALAPRITGE